MTSPRERRLQDFERRDLTSEMSHHADVHDQQEANTPGVAPLPFAPRYGYFTARRMCAREPTQDQPSLSARVVCILRNRGVLPAFFLTGSCLDRTLFQSVYTLSGPLHYE